MKRLFRLFHLAQDERAQDFIEYALLEGFLALAAGASLPGVSEDLDTIWRRVSKLLYVAAGPTNGPSTSRLLP